MTNIIWRTEGVSISYQPEIASYELYLEDGENWAVLYESELRALRNAIDKHLQEVRFVG